MDSKEPSRPTAFTVGAGIERIGERSAGFDDCNSLPANLNVFSTGNLDLKVCDLRAEK